ncbi:hypothetical protein KQX54_015455 [Cotesia glomerata]|uniref:Uncharacterized protein n=1 Tax=Cotesia glomerata TaxID=32391 RepID=A0AAV7IW17_COTGL|nr:hypothetical protein KQX54_015455 [Cotesia glomerata]
MLDFKFRFTARAWLTKSRSSLKGRMRVESGDEKAPGFAAGVTTEPSCVRSYILAIISERSPLLVCSQEFIIEILLYSKQYVVWQYTLYRLTPSAAPFHVDIRVSG